MNLTTAFWYVAAAVVLLVLLQVLARPLGLFLKVIAHGVAGGIALWLINLAGGYVGLHVGLNPVSAIVVGLLGLPGLISLGVIHLLVR